MKSVIIYASPHHGNTQRVVERMAKRIGARTVDILKEGPPDISGYKLIGLASGAYFGTLHEAIAAFAGEAAFTPDHRVFLAATCGAGYKDHTYRVRKLLEERGVACLGRYQCRGYDTYGPWKLIGGIARKHPDETDLRKVEIFAKRMVKG